LAIQLLPLLGNRMHGNYGKGGTGGSSDLARDTHAPQPANPIFEFVRMPGTALDASLPRVDLSVP
jgi:hypothetical protein